jgi:5-methyltetrahydropteroyltriglutamate--homocysteine methyltransferase
MPKQTDRILTTHTGSLPRPADLEGLLVAIDRDATVRSNTKDLPRLLDEAVHDIVKHQHAAGIDIVSDGEASKFGYSTYVRERLTGLEGRRRRWHWPTSPTSRILPAPSSLKSRPPLASAR